MVSLRNSSIDEILHRKEKLIVYGASRHLENMLAFFSDRRVADYIQFVVDQDDGKNGCEFMVAGFKFPVVSLNHFLELDNISLNYQMIIVIECYWDAIRQLDGMPALDGMSCYVWWMPFLSGHSQRSMEGKLKLPLPDEKYEIPKVIHYCWFGDKELPESAKKCIQSWKRACPDFEIREWNETNYDVGIIPYTREAYGQGKFSFVSDYARYDIVSRYGGFYFDTDVELLRSVAELSRYRGFFSFEYNHLVNSGSGFAAQKDDEVILELRNKYHNRKFLEEGLKLNLKPCSEYETEYFMGKGLNVDDKLQQYNGFLILPYEFFSPVNQISAMFELTQNTFGIHRFECTWLEKEAQDDWNKKKNTLSEINERLVGAWKREAQKQ